MLGTIGGKYRLVEQLGYYTGSLRDSTSFYLALRCPLECIDCTVEPDCSHLLLQPSGRGKYSIVCHYVGGDLKVALVCLTLHCPRFSHMAVTRHVGVKAE